MELTGKSTGDAGVILDRYWDAVATGPRSEPEPGLSPVRAEIIQRLHALDQLTTESPRADELWRRLIEPPVAAPVSRPAPRVAGSNRAAKAISLISVAALIAVAFALIVVNRRDDGIVGNRALIPAPIAVATPSTCLVTQPNGLQPPPSGNAFGAGYGDLGNASLWTSLWVWGQGVVAVPADHINAQGEAEDLKWPWYRFVRGELSITGHRLDGDAPRLAPHLTGGYGDLGFEATGITFPTPGCWEITGHVGGATLTFVVWVVYQLSGTPSPSGLYGNTTSTDPCPRTQPNGVTPPAQSSSPGDYGNIALWTNLAMGSEEPGIVNVDRQHLLPDGTTDDLKWAWWRFAPGTLTIDGWRLDDPDGPRLQASIPDGYGDDGFQVSGLRFPSPGCWEVIGSVGGQELAFIVDVRFPDLATPTS